MGGKLQSGGSFSNTAPHITPEFNSPEQTGSSNPAVSVSGSYQQTPMQVQPQQLSGAMQQYANAAAQMPVASPMQMPASPAATTDPTGGADQNTVQLARNLAYLQSQGAYDTPYQKAMKAHPFLMGLANAAQTFGQGLTHQPFATTNQEVQGSIQNAQNQGIMGAVTLPQQLRLMQAMYAGNTGSTTQPTNIPGVTPMAPVIATPTLGSQGAPANPMAAQMAAARSAGYSDQEIQAYLAGKK